MAIDVDVGVARVKAGSKKIAHAFKGLGVKLGVIDWSSEGVKIGDEHVDVVLIGISLGELDDWKVGAEKVPNRGFFVGTDAS